MVLTEKQNEVFDKIKIFIDSDSSVFILRGYAGTGKTTMVKVIANYISEKYNVTLMAPTGRAARILKQKTGYNASTIHRAIYEKACLKTKDTQNLADSEYKLVFPINISENKEKNVVIVDEASMVCSRKIEHELYVFGTDNLMDDLLSCLYILCLI